LPLLEELLSRYLDFHLVLCIFPSLKNGVFGSQIDVAVLPYMSTTCSYLDISSQLH
jgi:hypothetical protein